MLNILDDIDAPIEFINFWRERLKNWAETLLNFSS